MGARDNVISLYREEVEQLKKEADFLREELGDDLTGHPGKARREAGKAED